MNKPIYAIVAVAEQRVIGRDGRLPWAFPSDTAYFLDTTRGGVMIEGPACYRELDGALDGRGTIVISRDVTSSFPGAVRVGTLGEALAIARESSWPGPVWIAGGEWLYAAALPLCDRLYITEIGAGYEGDRFFPAWGETHPVLLSSREVLEAGVLLRFAVYGKSPDGGAFGA